MALSVILKEPKITSYTAARNLWNLFAIDYFDKQAMERFSQVLLDCEPEKLHHLDIANALRSFAHFHYLDYDCLEVLIKETIKRAEKFEMQTLAVILNSLAALDISNPTLLTICKHILLQKIDAKATLADGEPLITVERPTLKPIDCAMFMAAFSRAEIFDDPALQESLLACFIERVDEADGETVVTILNAHAEWCHHIIDTVLIKKKQPKRVYSYFIKYNDQVLAKVIPRLIEKSD